MRRGQVAVWTMVAVVLGTLILAIRWQEPPSAFHPSAVVIRFAGFATSPPSGQKIALIQASNALSRPVVFAPFASVMTESKGASGTHSVNFPPNARLAPHEARLFPVAYPDHGNTPSFQLFWRPWRGSVQERIDDLKDWARSRGLRRGPARSYLGVECAGVPNPAPTASPP